MTAAQQVVLDSPVKAGPLTLFPDMEDGNTYYYLSDKPRLARSENGTPKFSFLRFVENTKSSASTAGARSEGEGGGIVHAVVELAVTPEHIAEAERELKRLNSNGKIQGPIIYTGGTIALISSIAQANGTYAKTVIGLGKAPILDGQQAAISVLLTKQGAKILRESFNTPTPDMSVSFEMTISGFRKPKKAIIEANFESIYKHKAFQAAVAAPILQAEINMAFDEMVKSGAIKVINKGADEQMEALITDAYNKLTRMMFEPTGGTGTPSLSQLTSSTGGRPSMLDRASALVNGTQAGANTARTNTQAGNNPRPDSTASPRDTSRQHRPPVANRPNAPGRGPLSNIAIAASFEMREEKLKGTYRIDLEKWSKDNLSMRFDENFGAIKCEACFRDINLDDPLYRQREVTAFLDGFDSQDFGKYVNFVSVQVKKKHEGGDITEDELRIDKKNFNEEGNNFALVYGWKNDNNSKKWSEYEYRSVWNFFGGGLVEQPWQKSNINTIPLAAPFVRSEILVESEPEFMKEKGVRGAELKFYFDIAGKEQTKLLRMNMKKEEFTGSAEIYVPRNSAFFEYEVTWFFSDGSSKNSGRRKSTNTVIYIDKFPD